MKLLNAKKTISLMLALSMLLSVLTTGSFTAFADTVLTVTSEEEFVSALNRDSVVDEIQITSDFTIGSDCTINYDSSHINYYSDTVVTVAEGVTLTVGTNGAIGSMWPSYNGDWNTPPLPNGKVINNGKVIVSNGGIIAADFDTNNGEVIVKSGGEAVIANTNNGTVSVEDGGIYATTQGNKAVNNGTINVYSGAVIESRYGCTLENSESGIINLYGTFNCGCFNDNGDDFWFNNKGTVNGNGDVILYPAMQLDNMDSLIEKMMTQLGQTSRFDNWDDVNIFKKVEVADYAELVYTMTGNRTVAGENVEGNMDTIIDLLADVTIPAGSAIGAMVKVNVPDGITLTVNDGASLSCGIENDGNVIVKSGGELATTQGGAIINRNSLVVEDGAEIRSQMGGEVINENNATLTLDGVFNCGCIGINGDCFWFDNNGIVNGGGDIVLIEITPVDNMDGLIESMMTELGQTSRFDNWDDINIYKKVDVSDYAEFEAAISSQRTVASEEVPGNMDTIIELTADITVPEDADIGGMVLVKVPSGVTLTVSGGASLSCGIENDGTVAVQSGGKLATTQGGAIINRNTLTVAEGAELKSQMGGEVINENGATITLDGVFNCGCYGDNGNDIAWFENHGIVNGFGIVTIYEADHDFMPISNIDNIVNNVTGQIFLNGGIAHVIQFHYIHTWDEGVVTRPATAVQPGVMTYTCTVCGQTYEDSIKYTPAPVPEKKNNTLFAKGKTVKLKAKKLKKKKQTVVLKKAITVSNAIGAVSFNKVKGNKKITVAKNGKITVKKGLKKGTYKVRINVAAAGNSEYKPSQITVTVKIKVK